MTFPTVVSVGHAHAAPGGGVTIANAATSGQLAIVIATQYLAASSSRTLNISGGTGTWYPFPNSAWVGGSGTVATGGFYSTTHDGSSVTVTASTGGSTQWVAQSMVVTGFDTSNPIEDNFLKRGSTLGVAFDTFYPTPGADDYLWVGWVGNSYGGATTPSYSSNLPDNNDYYYGLTSNGGSSAGQSIATVKVNAASLTPNTATWSGNGFNWYSGLFVVNPARSLIVPNQRIIIP